MIGLFLSRNGLTLIALLAFLSFAWLKAEKAVERHDARVSREAVTNTITKIETANADSANAGTQAAKKSRGEIVEVPSIWPHAVWSTPAGTAARRVRKPQVPPGRVIDPSSHDD